MKDIYEHTKAKEFYSSIFKNIGFDNENSEDKKTLKEKKSVIEEQAKNIQKINIKVDELKDNYIVNKEMKNVSVIKNPKDLFFNFNLQKEEVISLLKENLTSD